VRQLVRELNRSECRWSSLILGIVQSTPFQMRRALEPATGPAAATLASR
jgi:hypothetical protein